MKACLSSLLLALAMGLAAQSALAQNAARSAEEAKAIELIETGEALRAQRKAKLSGHTAKLERELAVQIKSD